MIQEYSFGDRAQESLSIGSRPIPALVMHHTEVVHWPVEKGSQVRIYGCPSAEALVQGISIVAQTVTQCMAPQYPC